MTDRQMPASYREELRKKMLQDLSAAFAANACSFGLYISGHRISWRNSNPTGSGPDSALLCKAPVNELEEFAAAALEQLQQLRKQASRKAPGRALEPTSMTERKRETA